MYSIEQGQSGSAFVQQFGERLTSPLGQLQQRLSLVDGGVGIGWRPAQSFAKTGECLIQSSGGIGLDPLFVELAVFLLPLLLPLVIGVTLNTGQQ